MQKENALATVIVPVYRVEEFLPSCIESIQAQTYPHLQILLVDDGSPDRCGAICDRYAQEDPRIEVVHQANGGVGAARNAGLARAKGDYIYFVDGDDLAAADMVRRSAEELESGPYDLCLWGKTVRKDGASYYCGRWRKRVFRLGTERERERFFCRWFLTARTGWEVFLGAFRRSLVSRFGLRFGDGIFAEDMDFTFRYLLRCRSLCLLPEPLSVYRVRPSSAMRTIGGLRRAEEIARLLNRQRKELSETVPFGRFYLCGSAALATLLEGEGLPGEKAGEWLEALKRGEGFAELLADLRQALTDRRALYRACGPAYGSRVQAVCGFLLEEEAGRRRKSGGLYSAYGVLRGWKQRLLHPKNERSLRAVENKEGSRDDRTADVPLGG
ncbi:MAG: glycosyltransferase family 2 protein [Provencibacterium sp.]|jgi:glycosyltransferase involved in cell wall biosynthesis|nr:glycosyltransferase family 2 protein [Provencibacterium sp.]